MGSDFTEFRGYGFWYPQSMLGVWCACLLRELGSREVPGWLEEKVSFWRAEALSPPTYVLMQDESWADEQVAFVLEISRAARDRLARDQSLVIEDLDAVCGGKIDPPGVRRSRAWHWEPRREAAMTLWLGNRFVRLLEGTLLMSGQWENGWLHYRDVAVPVVADLWRSGDRWGGVVSIEPQDDRAKEFQIAESADWGNAVAWAFVPAHPVVEGATVQLQVSARGRLLEPTSHGLSEATVWSVTVGLPDPRPRGDPPGPCVRIHLLGTESIPPEWLPPRSGASQE